MLHNKNPVNCRHNGIAFFMTRHKNTTDKGPVRGVYPFHLFELLLHLFDLISRFSDPLDKLLGSRCDRSVVAGFGAACQAASRADRHNAVTEPISHIVDADAAGGHDLCVGQGAAKCLDGLGSEDLARKQL